MRLQKATFELDKNQVDRLRELREDLRRQYDLPVTQRLIIEYLIEHADIRALRRHFSATLDRRLGIDENDLKRQRRLNYSKRKEAARK